MSSTSSAESAASASASNEPGCEPSRSARSSRSAAPSSPSAGQASPSTTTCEVLPLSGSAQMELLPMSSVAASPARTSASPEKAQALRASAAAYGQSTPDLLASYDRSTSSWRTSQLCLVEGLTVFSETWPRSGLMRNGTAYQLPPLVPLTEETGSGLWPTPVVPNGGRSVAHVNEWRGRTAYHNGKKVQVDLAQVVKRWPTPVARMWKDNGSPSEYRRNEVPLAALVGGALNPTWVEWLMGFPLGWTDLKASATPSSRKSPKSSAAPSCEPNAVSD